MNRDITEHMLKMLFLFEQKLSKKLIKREKHNEKTEHYMKKPNQDTNQKTTIKHKKN